MPHDERFTVIDDSSDLITKNKRVKTREFKKYAVRKPLYKVCDERIASENVFYDVDKKDVLLMERLGRKTMKFDNYSGRSMDQSIYQKDWQASQNPYDFGKVEKGMIKTTKGSEKSNLLDLNKQKKRDMRQVYRGTVGEAYANIQRDNEKADYIKRLLHAQ